MASRACRLALWFAACLSGASPHAYAVGNRIGPARVAPTTEKHVSDLSNTNAAKRRYAARVLLRWVHTARRQAARGPQDDLTRAEALQTLTNFDQMVAPRCTADLHVAELTGPCADILRLLETQSALEALHSQLAKETRRGVQRRLQRAIDVIKEAQS